MTLILPQLALAKGLGSDQERKRLEELYSMDALDTSTEERFAHYTALATHALEAPIASVVLVNEDRLVFKAIQGHVVQEMRRESSFAAHAMLEDELLVVEDARADPRFASHPLVAGEPHMRSYAGAPIRGPSGQPLGAICVMDKRTRTFTEKDRQILLQLARILEHEMQGRATAADLSRRIREHVLFDSATQLPNEALFTARLERAIEKSPKRPIMIALIRLERFEAIHSAVGKPGAAYLARSAALRLKQALSRSCLIGQVREDTIALAFVLKDAAAPEVEIEKLLECFREPYLLGEHTLAATASIGTSMHPHDGKDTDSLLKRARTALNAMPQSDSSRYRRYNRKLSAEAARRFEIETALKGALQRDELELAFQPKVMLETRRLVGAEALLRWTTPKLGPVPPGEFIPIAEESGLIVDLGDWALASACKQLAAWRAEGLDCREVAVNVSSIQMRQARFSERVAALLADHSLEGTRLNLEITESTLIENIAEAIRIMAELRTLNVTISIDDFGKGFSSLSYLSRMPVQALKIDRSFVDRIPEQASGVTLVRSIVAMGHALGLGVIAEGIERREQLDVLRAAGCNQIQGFLVSRPLAAGDFARQFLMRESHNNPLTAR